tara:strand:- start:1106 stop:1294 length:189 start_codon:yes stop_codon:yes gene_type:complete
MENKLKNIFKGVAGVTLVLLILFFAISGSEDKEVVDTVVIEKIDTVIIERIDTISTPILEDH